MFVRRAVRGRGLSRLLLDAIEQRARLLGAHRLVLETGVRQTEAVGLYRSAGYTEIERFGEYADSPLSLCMAKTLG
jgi:GNAT superfamily N-acetyltransferase